MIDLRPLGYVVGLMVAGLGVTMLFPLAADWIAGNGHWPVFLESALITILAGGLTALASSNATTDRLNLRQTFLLTTGVWLVLPVFGAIPFILGATDLGVTDAFFEAMSGLTTTGATVLVGIEGIPEGLKLWRGILQWLGGIGIVVVAMVFLPELRVGGMQIFRSAGMDTHAKILPRATEIAARIAIVYLLLTVACGFAYSAAGQSFLDATTHAMTTLATGGFANYDRSFADLGAATHYIAVTFMLLAALPFVRYVQLLAGTPGPFLRDTQIRTFLILAVIFVTMIALWQTNRSGGFTEENFRHSLFNVVSILTGTGYASADYMRWGSFPVVLIFFIGLIGGCAGSTSCSIKVFRYQLLFSSIRTQIQRLYAPSGVFDPRYAGRAVSDDVLNSVMAFFVVFIVSLGLLSVALGMTGLDFVTSVSGAAAAIANIGPGLGEIIGPKGNYQSLDAEAKWLLSAAMLFGRLELMAVLVLLTATFWRD